MTTAEVVIGIEAGQDVPIARAFGDGLNDRRIDCEVDPVASRFLLLVDGLNADIAVQIAKCELRREP